MKAKEDVLVGQLSFDWMFKHMSEQTNETTAKEEFVSRTTDEALPLTLDERVDKLVESCMQTSHFAECNEEGLSKIELRKRKIFSLSSDQLVVRYLKLIKKIVFDTIFNTGADASFDFDDLVQIGCIKLVDIAKKYDGRTEFSTFVYTCVQNALRSYITKNKYHINHDCRTLMDDETMEMTVDSYDLCESFSSDSDDKISNSNVFLIITELTKDAKPATRRNVSLFIRRFYGDTIEMLAQENNVDKNKISTWIGEGKRYLSKQSSIIERAVEKGLSIKNEE